MNSNETTPLPRNWQHGFSAGFLLLLACLGGWAKDAPPTPAASSVKIAAPPNTTVGAKTTITFTVLDQNKKPFTGSGNKGYSGKATVTVVPGSTTPSALPQISFALGVATIDIQFGAAGMQTITVANFDPVIGPGTFSTTVTVGTASTSANALAGCATCFASIGAGTLLVGKYPDYEVSSNVLQATHVGISTPSFAVGVAYKLPFHDFYGYKVLDCTKDDLTTKTSDARVAFCYPWKSFVSLKLTPGASQTLNGFTFGLSHGLHQYLDLMIGLAYSAHNEISPGFQQAAVSVVRAQQAEKNPYYAQFNLAALQENNTQTAYDGFPTQFLNANGTTGSLIYNGSITISHYRPGLFLGVSLPLSFKSAVSGQ
jgi:hypothetical protein